jgi:hypothetical protein
MVYIFLFPQHIAFVFSSGSSYIRQSMMGLGETGKAAHGKSQVTANPAGSSLILVLYYPPSVHKNTKSGV